MSGLKKFNFGRGSGLNFKNEKKRNGIIRHGDILFVIKDYEVVSFVFQKKKLVNFNYLIVKI